MKLTRGKYMKWDNHHNSLLLGEFAPSLTVVLRFRSFFFWIETCFFPIRVILTSVGEASNDSKLWLFIWGFECRFWVDIYKLILSGERCRPHPIQPFHLICIRIWVKSRTRSAVTRDSGRRIRIDLNILVLPIDSVPEIYLCLPCLCRMTR